MKYLDYVRLSAEGIDPVLREFLIKVCQTDSVRRAQVAFPEFFSEKPSFNQVRRSDLRTRYVILDEASEADNPITASLQWFGIPVVVFEIRKSGKAPDTATRVLPADFELKYDKDYNGLIDDPWIADVPDTSGKEVKYLVLDILGVRGNDDTQFFVWTTPAKYILLDEEEPNE